MLDNIIPVWYTHGMRGNAIYRILATHPEAYWYNYVHAGSNSQHPLHIPSNATYIEGLEDGNNIAVKIGMWKMGYATYHTCSLLFTCCIKYTSI